MPLPNPRRDEDRNAFVGRCISFVKHESRRQRTDAQIQAMCINQWNRAKKNLERKVFLHAHPQFKALGNALLVKGTLLKPGTFIGLDGVPTHYSKEFIKRVKASIIGKPIRFAHEISPSPLIRGIPKGETVGFWTGVERNGELNVRGYTFFPEAVKYLKKHPNIGLSMEADVITKVTQSHGAIEEAVDGMLTGGVYINDPACKTCRVTSLREVNLQREEKKENTLSATSTTEGDKEPFIEIVEDKELAAPTRGDFFDWISEQLTKAGIEEATVSKVLTLLKKAVKTPYPYPSPAKKTEEKAFLEAIEITKDFIPKELQDRVEFMKTCLKEKTMTECSAEWKKKQQEEPPKQPEVPSNRTPREQELEKALGETKTELEGLKKIVSLQETAAIEKLTGSIKEYDKDFNAKKFLEAITCPVTKRKMLEKYLSVLKQHVKPINLQIGEGSARAQVKKLTDEMFGPGMTFEKLFEIEESD